MREEATHAPWRPRGEEMGGKTRPLEKEGREHTHTPEAEMPPGCQEGERGEETHVPWRLRGRSREREHMPSRGRG